MVSTRRRTRSGSGQTPQKEHEQAEPQQTNTKVATPKIDKKKAKAATPKVEGKKKEAEDAVVENELVSDDKREEHRDASDDDDDESQKDDDEDDEMLTLATKPKEASTEPRAHSKEIGNGLTELIPGYIAPLQLDTSATTKKVSLSELRRRAERTDASTKGHLAKASTTGLTKTNFMPTTYAAYSFKMGNKKAPDLSAGKGWFGMQSTEITDAVKTDMAVIRNRGYLDPKRFYKRSDKFGKHVQVGTVIEGSAEYYSSRLTKKQRRGDLAQEIMADPESASYAKRKYLKITHERQAATAHFHKKKRKMTQTQRRGFR